MTVPSAAKSADAGASAKAELPPDKAGELCLLVAQGLEQNGHEAEAILQYEKARRYQPGHPLIARRLAVLYSRRGDAGRAMTEFTAALRAAPTDADLLNDFGYFQFQRGDYAEAEKWLRQATICNPQHQRAWMNLGLALGHQERLPESLEAFSQVVKPSVANANIGVILLKKGKTAEAEQILLQALELEPNLQQAQVALAKLRNGDTSPPEQRAVDQ
jgi:Tfp pilus assembly protein PilF